jgi:hypothetical protein
MNECWETSDSTQNQHQRFKAMQLQNSFPTLRQSRQLEFDKQNIIPCRKKLLQTLSSSNTLCQRSQSISTQTSMSSNDISYSNIQSRIARLFPNTSPLEEDWGYFVDTIPESNPSTTPYRHFLKVEKDETSIIHSMGK